MMKSSKQQILLCVTVYLIYEAYRCRFKFHCFLAAFFVLLFFRKFITVAKEINFITEKSLAMFTEWKKYWKIETTIAVLQHEICFFQQQRARNQNCIEIIGCIAVESKCKHMQHIWRHFNTLFSISKFYFGCILFERRMHCSRKKATVIGIVRR